MRFVSGWDSLLKRFLMQCQYPCKSILTVYPRAYDPNAEFESPSELEGPLVMCFKEFSKADQMPRFCSKVIEKSSAF